MATWVEIKGNRISFLRIMVGFLPLAFGYFLSVLFQGIDSLVADDLMTDLEIGTGTLGVLTAAFPLAFAAFLLPSGIAIDRFGPRTVQSAMMGVTALGALIFGLSTGPFGLLIGRALLGVGTASALLAGMKAVVTWFPRERFGLVTGGLITVAGLGALAMADPAALFVRAYGWRALFILLAARRRSALSWPCCWFPHQQPSLAMCRIKTTACPSSCTTRSFDGLRRSLRLWSGRYGRSRANGLQVGLPL